MGVSAAVFESAGSRTEHFVPGVYSRSYNVTSPAGVSAGNHVIMGQSQGGEPMKLLKFGTFAEAKDALVSGTLLDAIGYAFNASNDYAPQKVYAMRVNDGTQATLKLSANTVEIFELKSWDWGVHTNKLKVKVSTGSLTNSKRVSLVYRDKTETIDNIIKKAISLSYGGVGTATATVTKDSLVLTATNGEGETIDNYTFSFESYSKLGELETAINDTSVYSCSLLVSDDNTDSIELDTVSGVVLSSDNTVFYSNYVAFRDALKSSTLIGDVTELQDTVRNVPENTATYMYFSGGTAGSASSTQWNKALEALETEDIQLVSTPESSQTIQTLIANHCKSMSTTVNRRERTCILGGGIGITDAEAIERAVGFNSKYVAFVADWATASNPITGETEKISGAMLGCMLNAMQSGMAVNEPLTNKTLNILSFGKKRTISNMEDLIQGGVLVCNQSPTDANLSVVIRAITTFQGTGDLISCEISMTREDLYMNRDLRSYFANGIGHPNDVSVDAVVQTLKDAARRWNESGLIIPKGSDNVWNIKVAFNGDKVYLYYSRYLTAPRNFVFITATNHVYEAAVEL